VARGLAALLGLALVWPGGAAAQAPTPSGDAPPRVVASILPLHGLVAGVLAGRGVPELLLPAGTSPHEAGLRPSQAATLAAADVVFWIGPTLETFLADALPALAPEAKTVAAIELPDLSLLPLRPAGPWAEAGHGHEHEADVAATDGPGAAGVARVNPHLWLDPIMAQRIAAAAAETLAAADPAGAELYRRNAAALSARLAELDARIAERLAPLRHVRFIVFHDAYVYFETRYGLSAWGGVTQAPNQPPGARRLAALRAEIRAAGIACVFTEPQFRPALVETLIAGTDTRTAALDPLGVGLTPGPEAYFKLLENLTERVVACLSPG
jgi:zinc transport system substrate-binding protein